MFLGKMMNEIIPSESVIKTLPYFSIVSCKIVG